MKSIPSRRDILTSVADAGGRIAAVMPIHYPRALLRATGFQPVEVWGPPRVDPAEGDVHLQSYACIMVRHATAFLVDGGLDVADVVLVPHTCDAMQGMASVLIDFIETKQPILTLYHPRADRPCDVDFFVTELRRLSEELEKISGVTLNDQTLHEAIEREEEADRELANLAFNRGEIALGDRDFYTLLRSREYLPTETFLEIARTAPKGAPPGGGVPLMLSGILPEPMSIFDEIEEAGGRVIADDLAGCSRRAYPSIDEKDPYRRMARAIIEGPADPTRGTAILTRAAAIADRMKAVGAKGLLVYDVKFCEPELFDLPILKQHLADRGIPMLHIEFDTANQVSQQIVTRLEAFVETL